MNTFFKVHAAQERMLDYRAGLIATILANQNRNKSQRAVKPADFFPSLKVPHRKMSVDEMRTRVVRHFGINVRR
jgi:hypothetical protein